MSTPGAQDRDWDRFEAALLEGDTRGARQASAPPDPRDAFDAEEMADLKRLAAQARLFRSRSGPQGNVVLLHGITGSDLAVTTPAHGEQDIWVKPLHLIAGRIADLQLNAEATQSARADVRVRPTGVNMRYYAKAILSLRARWDVEPYSYDWRRDLDEAADGLAQLIRKRFPNQPVHLVAHSMGGLVARNFILRHAPLWDAMRDAELVAGGRLIMLGTPNYGSFSIPPVLTGSDQMMELLQRLDLTRNMPELLRITNTFVGSYMLLPAPSKLTPSQMGLYQRETWGNTPAISQRHLDRTYQFHKDLENGVTIDPSRMTYIAGARYATIASMNIVAPGEFEYRLGYMGDGRVPHELGVLPGVPTYYVDEVHGDLARNDRVLRALDQLLRTGRTEELVTTALRARAMGEPKMRDYRTAADRHLMATLETVAEKARNEGAAALTAEDQRLAADALILGALGTNVRIGPRPAGGADGPRAKAARPGPPATPIDLEVCVRFGDVTAIKVPVVVVGHYRGVEPVNAIGAIDAAMGGWIARAVKRGMISGQLGETYYVPSRRRVAADGVVVAGMGDYGQFGPIALRRLMANVATGASALGLDVIGTVLIGAGEGGIERDIALMEVLEGIGTGLLELRDEDQNRLSLRRIVLIERDPVRYFQLLEKLNWMAANAALPMLRLSVAAPKAGDETRARKADAALRGPKSVSLPGRRVAAGPRGFDEVRIAVERDESRQLLRFSALTKSSVVPVREVRVNLRHADEAAMALRKATTPEEQTQYGRLLYTYLMPEDFHELMDGATPVRLIVDSSSAAYPWEMACFFGRGGNTNVRWLGTDLRLTRQFKTLLSSAPGGFTPSLNDTLRVLVVADPAPEPALQLPGARTEGRRLVELLKGMNGREVGGNRVVIQVDHRIGPGECEPVEILALLLSGYYDIVHFSGHGDFDAANPKMSGWVFGADRVLTATDIFRARKVPRLVFANACFSGVVRESNGADAGDLTGGLASIAEAFLERGVPNYIGTGWPVDDQQAMAMAQSFYDTLLRRSTLGHALQAARQTVFDERFGSTWGAYQLYGSPGDTVLRPGSA